MAWDLSDENWGIENLNEKETSSSIPILILAWMVHLVWYLIICFIGFYIFILVLVGMCYLHNPNNVTITQPERPIKDDLKERLVSWLTDRPTFLEPLVVKYHLTTNDAHYESYDGFTGAQLDPEKNSDATIELTSKALSPYDGV